MKLSLYLRNSMLKLESDVIGIDALSEASKKLEGEIAKVIVGQK